MSLPFLFIYIYLLEEGIGPEFVLSLNSKLILEQGMGSEFVLSKHIYEEGMDLILVIIKNIEIQSDLPWV